MKVAIITGAGQGIGFEIARQLVKAGVQVLLNDIDPVLTQHAAQKICAETGGTCLPLPGDSSDTIFIQTMVDTAVAQFGRLDVVIANAGITLFGDFFEYSPEAFFRVMQVNLGGTFFLAQAASRVARPPRSAPATVRAPRSPPSAENRMPQSRRFAPRASGR